MVQMKEFRIVMPLSLEEYQVAQMYMVMKMQQQNTTGDEGVEVLENRLFENDELGKGQYTFKIYRLQRKAPSWLTSFAPSDALVMQEEAWNAFPRCKSGFSTFYLHLYLKNLLSARIFLLPKSLCFYICCCCKFPPLESVIKCPYFSRFVLTIETIHKEDNGLSENVHCLTKEQLAARKVEMMDIAIDTSDYWSHIIGSSNFDFSQFQSARTGRGPLLDLWQEQCNPVMTAYKLVTIDAPYWGFGSRLEQALLAGERALFLESHRNCFGWIDEWFGLSVEMMRELEKESDSSLNKKLGRPCLVEDEEDLDDM